MVQPRHEVKAENGGEGIRTLGRLATSPVFKTSRVFNQLGSGSKGTDFWRVSLSDRLAFGWKAVAAVVDVTKVRAVAG